MYSNWVFEDATRIQRLKYKETARDVLSTRSESKRSVRLAVGTPPWLHVTNCELRGRSHVPESVAMLDGLLNPRIGYAGYSR